MLTTRSLMAPALCILILSLLSACGDTGESVVPVSPDKQISALVAEPPAEVVAADDVTNGASEVAGVTEVTEVTEVSEVTEVAEVAEVAEVTEVAEVAEVAEITGVAETTEPAADQASASEEISPETLKESGQIELKQYTVAYIGSGTMGGGTLTINGESYPFKIAGLGIGGIGASSIDATGTVYNLSNLEAFPGTYGNARLGMTAGDSGGGKLWLRSPTGVVIELESEMRGLALTGGIDGIYIEWDESEGDESTVDRVMDGTEELVGDGIEAGADAVEKGIVNVKEWFDSK